MAIWILQVSEPQILIELHPINLGEWVSFKRFHGNIIILNTNYNPHGHRYPRPSSRLLDIKCEES